MRLLESNNISVCYQGLDALCPVLLPGRGKGFGPQNEDHRQHVHEQMGDKQIDGEELGLGGILPSPRTDCLREEGVDDLDDHSEEMEEGQPDYGLGLPVLDRDGDRGVLAHLLVYDEEDPYQHQGTDPSLAEVDDLDDPELVGALADFVRLDQVDIEEDGDRLKNPEEFEEIGAQLGNFLVLQIAGDFDKIVGYRGEYEIQQCHISVKSPPKCLAEGNDFLVLFQFVNRLVADFNINTNCNTQANSEHTQIRQEMPIEDSVEFECQQLLFGEVFARVHFPEPMYHEQNGGQANEEDEEALHGQVRDGEAVQIQIDIGAHRLVAPSEKNLLHDQIQQQPRRIISIISISILIDSQCVEAIHLFPI